MAEENYTLPSPPSAERTRNISSDHKLPGEEAEEILRNLNIFLCLSVPLSGVTGHHTKTIEARQHSALLYFSM